MKFAYLIMAHDNESQLKMLLDALDYEENDVYLHIDKKSNINMDSYKMNRAKLYLYKKYSVYWADFSQTKCQVFLLKEAIKERHDYYHLLSGHDFPIKSHGTIVDFFKTNYGKQFIHFEGNDYCTKETCRYYRFVAPLISRCKNEFAKTKLRKLESFSLMLQRKIGIKRQLYCGANWYSITHNLAKDFCDNSKKILKKVRWTISSDEYVLQTFYKTIVQDKYELFAETKKPEDYSSLAREIDWNRGSPYVWKNEDFEYLASSERMFARKFDSKIDAEIIKRISEIIVNKNEDGHAV